MAKSTKKTRRAVVEDAEPVVDEEDVEEMTAPVVKKAEPVVEKRGPSHFIAILKGASSYNLAGRTFLRGEPVEVPIHHFKMFKQNGWFLVQSLR